MRSLYKTFGKFWYLYVIGIMIVGFILIATSKKQLNAFRPGVDDSTLTVESEKVTEKNVPTEAYKCDDIDLVLQVPQGWNRVTKSGFDTFIHAPSATSFQIQVIDYYPKVNNEDASTLQQSLQELGYTFIDFQRPAANNYYVVYKKENEAGTTDYIEDVIWDRDHVVKLVATVNDQYYDEMESTIWNCFKSAVWNYENPIADGFMLVYLQNGDFEFAYPVNWEYGETDQAAYASDPETGASVTVTMSDGTGVSAQSISQLDYSDMLSQNRQNYQLQGFSQYDDHVHGEAVYSQNGVQVGVVQDLYANGYFLYAVTYEFPMELSDSFYEPILSGLSMTRIFYDPSEESEATEEDASSDDHSITMPGETDASQQQLSSEASSEASSSDVPSSLSDMAKDFNFNNMTPQTNASGTQAESTPAQDDESSTLAGALITTAGLSEQAASQAASIWDGLGLGNAAYAEAYAENDTYLIVMVETDMKVDYFLFLKKSDGSLDKITVNTDSGQAVYQAQ